MHVQLNHRLAWFKALTDHGKDVAKYLPDLEGNLDANPVAAAATKKAIEAEKSARKFEAALRATKAAPKARDSRDSRGASSGGRSRQRSPQRQPRHYGGGSYNHGGHARAETCFSCGQTGHRANECRRKPVSAFQPKHPH